MRADDQIELPTRLCGSLIANESFFLVLPGLNGVSKQARQGRRLKTGRFFKGIPSTCYEKTIFGIFQSTCKIKRDNCDFPKIISLAVFSKIDVNFRKFAKV